ncbi:MAG TPA: VOC family protein [Allosphingosinicella sp.]|nr:VOC family protein [Allosphingosinicella sp.]
MVPARLAQVAIVVEDLNRAKAFYGDTLGLPHLFDAPPGLAFFQCGETRLMLSRPEGPEAKGSAILYYGVDDVDSAYEEMKAKGAAFDEPPRKIAELDGKPVHLAVCRDGEGNLLGLISG